MNARRFDWKRALRLAAASIVVGIVCTMGVEETGRHLAADISTPVNLSRITADIQGWDGGTLIAAEFNRPLYRLVRAGVPNELEMDVNYSEDVDLRAREQAALEWRRAARANWGPDGPLGLYSLPTLRRSLVSRFGVPTITSLKAGWPWRVAGYELCDEMEPDGTRPGASWSRVLVYERTIAAGEKFGTRALPFGGLFRFWLCPSGVIGDVALFGAAFAAGAMVFWAARRAWRVRRGACGGCGYSVGSLARCPECGEVTKVSRRGGRAAAAGEAAGVLP